MTDVNGTIYIAGVGYRCWPGERKITCAEKPGAWRTYAKYESSNATIDAWDDLVRQSEAGKIPVKSSDSPNAQSVADLEKEPAVRYHMAAKRCGDMSIWCAAMAGAAIIQRKAELGHGKFETWKKTLPFSLRTADNYVALAKKLDEQIKALPKDQIAGLFPELRKAQAETQQSLALLGLPDPLAVFDPQHERIAELIRKVTNEQTLTQLYFAWDIIKPPAKLGGAREHVEKPLPEGETHKHLNAIEAWRNILAAIHLQTDTYKSHQHLRLNELKAVHEHLNAVRLTFADLIKKG